MISQQLFEQFSTASQKYKTGVLRVSEGDSLWELVVVDGRVIDVSRTLERDRAALLGRLVQIGALSRQDHQILSSRRPSQQELERFLVEEMEMSLEDLNELRSQIALDALFEIGRLQDAECEFSFQALRDYEGPGLDVNFGQFLLDVVEFSVDEERANQILESLRRGRRLVIQGDMPERMLPFEQLFLSLVEFPATYDDLERASMTRYDLVEGLLSLLDQGVLALDGEEIEAPKEKERERKRPEKTTPEDDGAARRKAQLQRPVRQTSPSVLTREADSPEIGKRKRTPSGRRYVRRSYRDHFINLNYSLLEEGQLQKVILWTHELFLLAVLLACLAGPQILETWFQGLSEFTSSLLSTHGTLK